MRKDHTLGIVIPALLFSAGALLLHESTTTSESYVDFFLIAGAAFSVTGLTTAFWTIQRRLSIRRME